MFKNRFFLLLMALSLMLIVAAAVSRPFIGNSDPAKVEAASDFHQRHPGWTWTISDKTATIPITARADYPDYYHRHPGLRVVAAAVVDMTDYYMRHPELHSSRQVDTTDYYFRHR